MSGGPPHHPHGHQVPHTTAGWNHLQVPNFYPTRQPQHAHMSSEHSIIHQPTWHTPTTEPLKPHSHIFSLEQMLSDRQFQRRSTPGVDLSVTRNGSQQNGELPTNPISLSVRDTNKINSLPVSALDIQTSDMPPAPLKALSPGLKSLSPGLSDGKNKRSSKRVDSILERLNPHLDKTMLEKPEDTKQESNEEKTVLPVNRGVIVQATSSHDENSNSSSILNVPTPTNLRDDDVVSPYSNEDSLDSNKSRRKRKPSKTVRVAKEEDLELLIPASTLQVEPVNKPLGNPAAERRKSLEEVTVDVDTPPKTRRKTSSESETIDNIAAMVKDSLQGDEQTANKAISVSVIKTKENLQQDVKEEAVLTEESPDGVSTSALKKPSSTDLVEVENKLEEMFAGIEDTTNNTEKPDEDSTGKIVEDLGKLEDDIPSTSHLHQDNVTSTSGEPGAKKSPKKGKRRQRGSRRNSDESELKMGKKGKNKGLKNVQKQGKFKKSLKSDTVKDIYAYDSGSNASSSKSRGPFIHIKGPRDSPLSVNVVNTPSNDDDIDRKAPKIKKYHDDSEYRQKVRTKGLHCSTLSNQYDAQTKDTSWICAFCKRGPHWADTRRLGTKAAGDLFGPYFITANSAEFERRLEDPFDKQFKSKKIARCLEDGASAKPVAKKKRKHSLDPGMTASTTTGTSSSEEDAFLGITSTHKGTFEIWAHEDCIVWSTGTYLVGPKIVGLEEAVWTSCNVGCAVCSLKGANICCLKRGCVKVTHVYCARLSDWDFDEDNYKTYCEEHRLVCL